MEKIVIIILIALIFILFIIAFIMFCEFIEDIVCKYFERKHKWHFEPNKNKLPEFKNMPPPPPQKKTPIDLSLEAIDHKQELLMAWAKEIRNKRIESDLDQKLHRHLTNAAILYSESKNELFDIKQKWDELKELERLNTHK